MSNIQIDNNKNLVIEGRKKFFVGLSGICTPDWDNLEACSISAPKNKNFIQYTSPGNKPGTTEWIAIRDQLEAAGIYWAGSSRYAEEAGAGYWMRPEDYNAAHFFGTMLPDEPDFNRTMWGACSGVDMNCAHNLILDLYNKIKVTDPDHPILLTIMGQVDAPTYGSSLNYWSSSTDILIFSAYTFVPSSDWTREQAVFAYERDTSMHVMWDIGGDLRKISRPVYATVQATASPTYPYYILSETEIRLLTYTAITMGVQGIAYWGYKAWGSPQQMGLVVDPTIWERYNQQAIELIGLNEILILSTESLRWNYFEMNKIVMITGGYNTPAINTNFSNFNWILKNDPVTGTKYLIIVNKGGLQAANATISISTLTGNQKISTIGNYTTGSGRTGRTLSGVNGTFQDTFDPQSVHIYKIEPAGIVPPPEPDPIPPIPPKNDNTITIIIIATILKALT